MRFRVALVIAICASTAAADPDTSTRAKTLFDEGRAFVKAGNLREACDRFDQSNTLDPQPGTQINLADCNEQQGQLLRAWQLFDRAAIEFEHRNNSAARAKFARQRADALAAKLAIVELAVAEPTLAGLELTIARVTVAASAKLEQRVEPGDLTVTARAPGRQPFERAVHVVAGAHEKVEIPVLAPIATTPAGAVPNPLPRVTVTPTAAPPAPAAAITDAIVVGRSRSRVHLAWGLGAAGGVAGVTAIVLGLVAKQRWNDAIAKNDPAAANSQVKYADVATVLSATSGVLLSASLVVYVTAPLERSTGTTVAVAWSGKF